MKSLGFFLYFIALSRADFTVEMQAEDGISTEAEKMFRSNAKNGVTVLIKQGASITLFFQMIGNSTCQMRAENLRYSHDGGRDEVTITLDQANSITLGSVYIRAASSNGELWNKFRNTGPIGKHTNIREGLYHLVITATIADEYGVEIDYVTLKISGCSNTTTTIRVIKRGYIRHLECTPCTCPPCEKLENYGIGTIVTGSVGCVIAFCTICVGIVLKCCDWKKQKNTQKNSKTPDETSPLLENE